MLKDKRLFDLEERLIDFAVRIIQISELLPKQEWEITLQANLFVLQHHLRLIMVKHQSAESRPDFIHKIR